MLTRSMDSCFLDLQKRAATHLARLVRNPDLEVSREEVVLEAVLAWRKAASDRDSLADVLLLDIDFRSLSLRALRSVDRCAQNIGPIGLTLQRETRKGIRAHGEMALEGQPASKRKCLRSWWPGLGATMKNGSVVVAGGNGVGNALDQLNWPWELLLYKDVLFICDTKNQRVVRWAPGANAGRVVAGAGAPVNGENDEIGSAGSITMAPDEELIVTNLHNTLLRFGEAGGRVIGKDFEHLYGVRCTSNGTVYILDDAGTRIQKIDGNTRTIVAGGHGEGAAATQFEACRFVVLDDGTLYICDTANHRVQRWSPGATCGETVAGGNGSGKATNQLSFPGGICRENRFKGGP